MYTKRTGARAMRHACVRVEGVAGVQRLYTAGERSRRMRHGSRDLQTGYWAADGSVTWSIEIARFKLFERRRVSECDRAGGVGVGENRRFTRDYTTPYLPDGGEIVNLGMRRADSSDLWPVDGRWGGENLPPVPTSFFRIYKYPGTACLHIHKQWKKAWSKFPEAVFVWKHKSESIYLNKLVNQEELLFICLLGINIPYNISYTDVYLNKNYIQIYWF